MMMYNREGGFGEKVRSYYLPGNTPAPPPEHRAYGSTSNAAEELINLTHLLFSARGGGALPVVPVEVTWPSSKTNARKRGFQLPLLIYCACDHMTAVKLKVSSAFRKRLWGVKIPTQVILKEDEGKSLKIEEEVSQ